MTTTFQHYGSGLNPSWRFVSTLPLAAMVTFALFLLMKTLITTAFTPAPVVDMTIPSIHPEVKELPPLKRKTLPDRTTKVELPPPPPRLAQQSSILPDEAIAPFGLPDITPPEPAKAVNVFTPMDRDVQPIVRIEPVHPARALSRGLGGRCKARFDVNPRGVPMNINVVCSSSVFTGVVVQAIGKWRYIPKIVDGKAVIRRGVETPVLFKM